MENKFKIQYNNYICNKKHVLIPTKANYDKMITTIQKLSHQKSDKLLQNDINLLRSYSIRAGASSSQKIRLIKCLLKASNGIYLNFSFLIPNFNFIDMRQ